MVKDLDADARNVWDELYALFQEISALSCSFWWMCLFWSWYPFSAVEPTGKPSFSSKDQHALVGPICLKRANFG